MQATPPRDWATREDFALLDGAPAFSVGSGAQAVTFWQSMVASTPELAARSAEDCERRWAELKPADDTAARVGPQPAVLEEWSRMADGRISGRIAGQPSAVWLTVALEGRLRNPDFDCGPEPPAEPPAEVSTTRRRTGQDLKITAVY